MNDTYRPLSFARLIEGMSLSIRLSCVSEYAAFIIVGFIRYSIIIPSTPISALSSTSLLTALAKANIFEWSYFSATMRRIAFSMAVDTTGMPASMRETFIALRARPIFTRSSSRNTTPGVWSPSRSVTSCISTLSGWLAAKSKLKGEVHSLSGI